MNSGPKGPSSTASVLAAQQAVNAQVQQYAQQQAAAMQNIHSAKMQATMNAQSAWYAQNKPRAKDTTITPELTLELLACGFTIEEIDKLGELAQKSATSFVYGGRVNIPVFYRRDARARNKCAFGTSRIYKKSHEVGAKKRPATIVYTPTRGYVRPFPEAKE